MFVVWHNRTKVAASAMGLKFDDDPAGSGFSVILVLKTSFLISFEYAVTPA